MCAWHGNIVSICMPHILSPLSKDSTDSTCMHSTLHLHHWASFVKVCHHFTATFTIFLHTSKRDKFGLWVSRTCMKRWGFDSIMEVVALSRLDGYPMEWDDEEHVNSMYHPCSYSEQFTEESPDSKWAKKQTRTSMTCLLFHPWWFIALSKQVNCAMLKSIGVVINIILQL